MNRGRTHHVRTVPHPFCHPERSAAKSKDLLFNILANWWDTENLKTRNYAVGNLVPDNFNDAGVGPTPGGCSVVRELLFRVVPVQMRH